MDSPDVYILMPQTCECVTLQGKRDFTDTIKLNILRREDYPGLSGWAQYNHNGPYDYIGRQEGRSEM